MNGVDNDSFDSLREQQLIANLLSKTGVELFKPGLDRLRPIFAPFVEYFKQNNIKILTIAGTNGKGETSMALTSMLQAQGFYPATWTSPHILTIRERFSFGGELVTYSQLEDQLPETWQWCSDHGHQLSYYELLFLIFCRIAKTKPVTHLVLEVGLGGRYDAVNLFDADVAAITSISRDHQAILGQTYRQILWQKIGVARPLAPLLTFYQLDYLRSLTGNFAQQIGAIYTDLQAYVDSDDYSYRNRVLALAIYLNATATSPIGIDYSKLPEKLSTFRLPTFRGRKELMTRGRRSFIFIGAHNVEGMRVLWQAGLKYQHALVAFSDRPQADVVAAGKIAKLVACDFEVTSFDHPKALPQTIVESLFPNHFIVDWRQRLVELCDIPGETVVMGSYYFIGEVQKYFANN